MTEKKDDTPNEGKWTTGAKMGAAVGSAALVAALLYAGKRSLTKSKGKLEPQSPEPQHPAEKAADPSAPHNGNEPE